MAVLTYTKSGTKSSTAAKLDKDVFSVPPINHELLKQAYLAYLNNGRNNLAKVKTRGEVRGGGKKPWRQKGTGRARFGSSRNPIWRGGGAVFAPTGQENYRTGLSTRAKRQAVRQALSLAVDGGKVVVIEDIAIKSGKTAELAKLLAKLGSGFNVLMVVDIKSAELIRASKNLPGVKVVSSRYLNVFDILNADQLILSESGLKLVTEWLKP